VYKDDQTRNYDPGSTSYTLFPLAVTSFSVNYNKNHKLWLNCEISYNRCKNFTKIKKTIKTIIWSTFEFFNTFYLKTLVFFKAVFQRWLFVLWCQLWWIPPWVPLSQDVMSTFYSKTPQTPSRPSSIRLSVDFIITINSILIMLVRRLGMLVYTTLQTPVNSKKSLKTILFQRAFLAA